MIEKRGENHRGERRKRLSREKQRREREEKEGRVCVCEKETEMKRCRKPFERVVNQRV